MMAAMSAIAKAAIGSAGLALVAGGLLLWAQFGQLVYFDVLAASFIGCFF